MSPEDYIMLVRFLIKLSKSLREIEISQYSHGWDEHKEEREYFEAWMNKHFPGVKL